MNIDPLTLPPTPDGWQLFGHYPDYMTWGAPDTCFRIDVNLTDDWGGDQGWTTRIPGNRLGNKLGDVRFPDEIQGDWPAMIAWATVYWEITA